MRAMQFAEYGPPGVFQTADLPVPKPDVGQVQIEIVAAGVNPADWKWRQGMFRDRLPLDLPHVPGYDVAGVISDIGSGVDGFAIGNRVVASVHHGYAEFDVVDQRAVARVPEGMDLVRAAVLPCAALSGVQMVEDWLTPRPSQRILITGATGAVGRFALYAALRLDAVVIAAVRPAYFDEARSLGAHEVIALEDAPPGDRTFDFVADTVGGPAVARLCRNLADGGAIATAATTPIDPEGLKATPVFRSYERLDGTRLQRIASDVAMGRVDMPIAKRLPLEEAAEAHRLIEAGGTTGKIALLVREG